MNPLPNAPFLTKDFSLRGGGIDFLGLRYVNLHMVGTDLIPELNNVTSDMGTFFLGTWIPWRFQEVCGDGRGAVDFTERSYLAFREKIEVAISLTMRGDSTAVQRHGNVRNRVGITQDCQLPAELTFKAAHRGEQNTLYAAAIYGPALQALHLIESNRAMAKDGHTLDIPVAANDQDTLSILQAVDESLAAVESFRHLISLAPHSFTWREIDALGVAGLCPAVYRAAAFAPAKSCFQRKLLPTNPQARGHARTRTTRLLLGTLRQQAPLETDAVRDIWYTGLFPDGRKLQLDDEEIRTQCERWSYFMARQYQRYAIELFLWCFETALSDGIRSVDAAVEYWEARTQKAGGALDGDFLELMNEAAGPLLCNDASLTSNRWNATVHGEHCQMEYSASPQDDSACLSGLRMCAGWYWRMFSRSKVREHSDLMTLGQSDRIGMGWFLDWLGERKRMSLRALLKEIFSDLVFSQHMRVALSRFDGRAQRLRFILGDTGIEPTVSAQTDLGKRALPWMPDRLDTLVALLCDIDVLRIGDDGKIDLGPQAATVTSQ